MKRIISIILTFVLIVTSISMQGIAMEEIVEINEEVESGVASETDIVLQTEFGTDLTEVLPSELEQTDSLLEEAIQLESEQGTELETELAETVPSELEQTDFVLEESVQSELEQGTESERIESVEDTYMIEDMELLIGDVAETDSIAVREPVIEVENDETISLLNVASIVASGSCGEGVFWTYSSDGVLSISGNGIMDDYTTTSTYGSGITTDVPWADYLDAITKVVIDENVIGIGKCAFSDCICLNEVSFLSNIIEIGESAFARCTQLSDIVFPDSLESIREGAFIV